MRRFFILPSPASHRLTALCLAALFLCLPFTSCAVTMGRGDLSDGTTDSSQAVINPLPDEPEDTRPRVALTFDDGPHYIRTKLVVDELLKYGYSATFFVVGDRIGTNDSSISYMAENGMEIGIHGYTHTVYYDDCTEEAFFREMDLTADAIRQHAPDYEVKLMRPVGGRMSSDIQSICPYSVIMWNVDSEDWKNKYAPGDTDEKCAEKVNIIVENALAGLKDGDIILMHDIYESTYDATVILLQRLNEMGYNVVSVSELFGDELQPGQKYYSQS